MVKSLLAIVSLLLSYLTLSTAFSAQPALTSAVLRVTYDGSLFHGWTASTDANATTTPFPSSRRKGRSRRNRLRPSMKKGEVRSVVSSLKDALSKLYGNIPTDRIVVEGSSRTDKGVHSIDSYALIYCLLNDDAPLAIEGKRIPHPTSARDENFKELPFNSDLKKMIFALNKMLPPDVRIRNASPMPMKKESSLRPFHPSLDSIAKTYQYTFSVGEIHDPIRCRDTWHVPHCKSFDLDRARDCAEILSGTHDFVAFRGAFRGSERGKVQNTVCTLFKISVNEILSDSVLCKTFAIDITGDRFLYKQVRFLVGTIVQYGKNRKIDKNDVINILESKEWHGSDNSGSNKEDAIVIPRCCAPAQGLCLKRVIFEDDCIFDWIVQIPEKQTSEIISRPV